MRFAVLGSVKVWRRGAELPLGPPKQRALLALLLLHAGETVGLSQIVDVLWHGDPPNSAVNVVHRHIGSLRKLLEPDLPPRAPGAVLVRRAGGTASTPTPPPSTCRASVNFSPAPVTPPTTAR